jgi:DNA-binding MarR family transcriptional regulator
LLYYLSKGDHDFLSIFGRTNIGPGLTAYGGVHMIHVMNERGEVETGELSQQQRQQFSRLLDKLYQCCLDKQVYLSEKFDIPQAELRCLMLFGQERYLTAKGIAARLGIAKSRVTKLVSGLVGRGLLVKVADPADSRVTLLALTPAGQKMRQAASEAMDAMRDAVLDSIDPDRRSTLLGSLDTLKTAMERVGESLE